MKKERENLKMDISQNPLDNFSVLLVTSEMKETVFYIRGVIEKHLEVKESPFF